MGLLVQTPLLNQKARQLPRKRWGLVLLHLLVRDCRFCVVLDGRDMLVQQPQQLEL